MARVSPPQLSEDGQAGMLTVIPRTAPQDAATEALVHDLRTTLDLTAYVGGGTAALVDQSEHIAGRLPLFIAGGVAVSLLLLLLAAFRAPVVALKAGVMNLFSVGAAYGVMALVAEGGVMGRLLGIDGEVPVPPFMPVMMFAILFGLSMD